MAVPPFSALIAATTRTAVHLETRDSYTPDDPAFLDWKAGRPVSDPAGASWYNLVREHAARGVRFRRARVVSEPMADYTRFEFASTAFNIDAGEQVRWLPRHTSPGLLVPLCDFWVFDDKLVRFGLFAGDGTFLRHEMADDPGVAKACTAAFERVWERAVPHGKYRPA
ncbi:MAG: DUF6879 family protein [Trebonia sp.]